MKTRTEIVYDGLVDDLRRGCIDWDYAAEWVELAKQDEAELEFLLALFYKEQNVHCKWRLGCALAELQQKEIIPELKQYLNHENFEVQEDMALLLVELEDAEGAQKLVELILDPPKGIYPWGLVDILRNEIKTDFSCKLADKMEMLLNAKEKEKESGCEYDADAFS